MRLTHSLECMSPPADSTAGHRKSCEMDTDVLDHPAQIPRGHKQLRLPALAGDSSYTDFALMGGATEPGGRSNSRGLGLVLVENKVSNQIPNTRGGTKVGLQS